MTDLNIGYAQPGAPTQKLSTEQIGTDGGVPVIVERMQLYPPLGPMFGNRATIGTASGALPSQAMRWATLRASVDNTATIWLGGSAVTVNAGFPLAAGDGVTVYVDNLSKVFAVAGAVGQALDFIGSA